MLLVMGNVSLLLFLALLITVCFGGCFEQDRKPVALALQVAHPNIT